MRPALSLSREVDTSSCFALTPRPLSLPRAQLAHRHVLLPDRGPQRRARAAVAVGQRRRHGSGRQRPHLARVHVQAVRGRAEPLGLVSGSCSSSCASLVLSCAVARRRAVELTVVVRAQPSRLNRSLLFPSSPHALSTSPATTSSVPRHVPPSCTPLVRPLAHLQHPAVRHFPSLAPLFRSGSILRLVPRRTVPCNRACESCSHASREQGA